MIEPTPTLFYSIIQNTFKERATLATRLVQKIKVVEPDSKYVKTLCIGKDGVILINPSFWKQFIRTTEDAKILLLHELFHAMTGDINKLGSLDKVNQQLANLSMDMRINAALYRCFIVGNKQAPGKADILTRINPSNGLGGLLRPGSSFSQQSKYRLIYNGLYQDISTQNTKRVEIDRLKNIFKSEESIRHALRTLIPKQAREELNHLTYLGTHDVSEEAITYRGVKSHEAKDSEPDVQEEYEDEVRTGPSEDVREEIRNALGENLKKFRDQMITAGLSSSLFDNVINVIESTKQINLKALEQFCCNHKVNQIKVMWKKEKRAASVVPITPTARDIALMASGIMPSIWHNKQTILKKKDRNIAIYLDVSGSVTEYLPKLLGIIRNLHKGIKLVYCFSNQVHEHTMAELHEGKYKSTGGTDFDCIIDHVYEKDVDKIVIFTDGYADVIKHAKKKAEIRAKIKDAAVVYFGAGVNRNNWFENEYKKGFTLQELTNEQQ